MMTMRTADRAPRGSLLALLLHLFVWVGLPLLETTHDHTVGHQVEWHDCGHDHEEPAAEAACAFLTMGSTDPAVTSAAHARLGATPGVAYVSPTHRVADLASRYSPSTPRAPPAL